MKQLGFRKSEQVILRSVLSAILLLSAFCLVLMAIRMAVTGTARYGFIPFNIFLVLLTIPVTGWLLFCLRQRLVDWTTTLAGICWLLLLPNSWYVLTDFIHFDSNGEISELYDIVLLFSFGLVGLIVGTASLFLVHQALLSKIKDKRFVNSFIAGVILVSSFAIYLGRDLRWNSWDVITRPLDIVVDISDRLVDPFSYPRAFSVTLLFFVFIGLTYICTRRILLATRASLKR